MSNEQKDWIGKKLVDKDNPKLQHEVVGNENGTLILSNNARIEENNVNKIFKEMSNDEKIDVDSFFNRGSSEAILSAIQNPINEAASRTKSIGVPDSNYNDGVVQLKFDNKPTNVNTNVKPQFNNHGLEEELPVRKVYGESMKEVVDEDEYNQYALDNQRKPSAPIVVPTINPLFKNIKKSHPIKIKLILDEKIPKIDAIRNLDAFFEDSIVDHLAKDITSKYLQNPELLENLVKEHLESLIFPNKKKKSNKKKPVKRTIKKVVAKTEDPKND